MERTYIIIPALEPEPGLCGQIAGLRDKISSKIVVVDDGSGADYRKIFDRVAGMDDCLVLRHEENKGKGQALKTGFRYVRESAGTDCRILCLDCDGQHLPEDGVRLLETVEECPGALILGGRDFTGKEVPWKSRFGNRVSSVIFWLFGGMYLGDTQTGFRAFDGSLLDLMLQTPGDRFEYETRVLLVCAQQGIPIVTEKIETVYVNDNAGTHFRPVRDSIRVMGALFQGPGRFVLTSMVCTLLDLSLFWIFEKAFGQIQIFRGSSGFSYAGNEGQFWRIAAATVAARVLSAAVNFALNRSWVFHKPGKPGTAGWKGEAFRYLLLCVGTMAASSLSVYAVSSFFHTEPVAAKLICDGVLFFFSYRIQRIWVFLNRRKVGGEYGVKEQEGRGQRSGKHDG